MASVTRIAAEHNIKGRGRCAPEGLNCTLSGSAAGVRAFCQSLRDWNTTFKETDFKVADRARYACATRATLVVSCGV
jgi:predicted sulfurtransferase